MVHSIVNLHLCGTSNIEKVNLGEPEKGAQSEKLPTHSIQRYCI